ncbi:hypothetical protein HK104_005438 [Borealophlyctis nickersoniae]|nr:hypothetical protein HK104_005438 [Borealophlyctis nickersoniae]
MYTTNVTATGPPRYVAWISQLNCTYSDLVNVSSDGLSGVTVQPGGDVYPPEGGLVNGTQIPPQVDPTINGTMFIAVVDDNPVLTSYNLSVINQHTIAGPAIYAAG